MIAKVQRSLVLAYTAAHYRALKAVREIPAAVCFFGGLAAIAWGSWMIYRPLGPIIGGLFAIWVSILINPKKQ